MSAFLTVLEPDVAGVIKLLPRESFVESVSWNEHTRVVEVVWSNRNLVTPYSVPTPFTKQMLHDQEIPKCATLKSFIPPTPPNPAITVTDNVKVAVDKPRRKNVKVTAA